MSLLIIVVTYVGYLTRSVVRLRLAGPQTQPAHIRSLLGRPYRDSADRDTGATPASERVLRFCFYHICL